MMTLVSKDVKCQKIERGWQVAIGNLPKGLRKSLKVDLRNLVPRKLVQFGIINDFNLTMDQKDLNSLTPGHRDDFEMNP